jgi:hypothetical protein
MGEREREDIYIYIYIYIGKSFVQYNSNKKYIKTKCDTLTHTTHTHTHNTHTHHTHTHHTHTPHTTHTHHTHSCNIYMMEACYYSMGQSRDNP